MNMYICLMGALYSSKITFLSKRDEGALIYFDRSADHPDKLICQLLDHVN